jgi:hypothetical protein
MNKIIFFFLLLPMFCAAQITTKPDSTGKQVVIVSTNTQPDGTTITVESAPVDTATVVDRLFLVLTQTYASVGRIESEKRELDAQAKKLVTVYKLYDTTTYTKKVEGLFASGIYGTFIFTQDNVKKEVEFRANATGNPIAQTGSTRGSITMYSSDYILVKNYFKTKAGASIDVYLCKKGTAWVTEIENKKITLRPKKQ